MPNASVLPEPVWPRPSTSRPPIASGMVAAWIGNGAVMSSRASVATRRCGTPRSAKRHGRCGGFDRLVGLHLDDLCRGSRLGDLDGFDLYGVDDRPASTTGLRRRSWRPRRSGRPRRRAGSRHGLRSRRRARALGRPAGTQRERGKNWRPRTRRGQGAASLNGLNLPGLGAASRMALAPDLNPAAHSPGSTPLSTPLMGAPMNEYVKSTALKVNRARSVSGPTCRPRDQRGSADQLLRFPWYEHRTRAATHSRHTVSC